jgi:tight adherence protein C
MGLILFVFLVIFLLLGSGGLLLFYREAMIQRISAVISPKAKTKGVLPSIQRSGNSLATMVEQFERVIPKSRDEISVLQRRLIRAGFRQESAVNIFYGAKVIVPLLLCLVALITGLGSFSPMFVYAVALGIGYLIPDFWLGKQISKRQSRIRRGLPDALDLMIICVEAGLSLDQSVARTAYELRSAQPAISDEMGVITREQGAGRPRADVWRQFAERTQVDNVRNLVSVLVQAEKFGTSIAKTLRVHSETLRTQRRQEVEEQAAKTTVKLIFPLVLFIFPSLFLVTIGPAMIIMMESFSKYLNH